MPIDHVGVNVPKALLEETLDFYNKALAPIGYSILIQPTPFASGYGLTGTYKADFWVTGIDVDEINAITHFAFTATDRKQVDEFYAAGLASGGKDNGAPGIRAHYHPNYYGGFLIDPAGHTVEVVCHTAPAGGQ